MQLIIVCETRASCQSDYLYIKSVLDFYYEPRSFGIKKIFATSKSELIKQEKKISKEISNYKGETNVVIVSDVDTNDENLNNEITQYAKNNNYHLIWMNGDIEEVFLGRKVKDRQKKNEATKFLTKYDKILPTLNNLSNTSPLSHPKTSNILLILDSLLKRKDT